MKKKTLLALFLFWAAVELPAQTVVQEFFDISNRPAPTADMDLPKPTLKGSVLIAMPGPLSSNIKALSITDNAPGGGNTYKQVPGALSSCGTNQSLDIWYCENCKGGVTELKFHLSGAVRMSINNFIELSNMRPSAVLDGTGTHLNDGTRAEAGSEVGPAITTTATDFIVARYHSDNPIPTGVGPAPWKYKTTYVYAPNAPAGTYQPTLTGKGTSGTFCVSMAAFKTAAHGASTH
ncbi:MAG: hypothetical protein WCC04_13620 [Terriglobales bacterium]